MFALLVYSFALLLYSVCCAHQILLNGCLLEAKGFVVIHVMIGIVFQKELQWIA